MHACMYKHAQICTSKPFVLLAVLQHLPLHSSRHFVAGVCHLSRHSALGLFVSSLGSASLLLLLVLLVPAAIGCTASSSGDASCMVYVVAADIRYRADSGIYVRNCKHYLHNSDLNDAKFTMRTMPHMHAVGMAKLVPATLCNSICTVWTPEEHQWWTCMGFADDVASLRVVDCSKCNTPVPSHLYFP